MKTGLIILGMCLAVLILIEVVRYKPKQKVKEVNYSLVFKPLKDGNHKATKRINEYLELHAFNGDSYTSSNDEVFIQMYVLINISGREYKKLIITKHVLVDDLNRVLNIFV